MMKHKRIIAILVVVALAFSCKNDANETKLEADTNVEKKSVTSQSKETSTEIKDCDDFLNSYEKWANDLIELMAKHKDDPVTLATSPEYMSTIMESANYMKNWQNIALSCSKDKSYEKRIKSIQDNLNQKQKELGLK